MKIVQFQNGKWAIQRGWIFEKRYKSRLTHYWWRSIDYYFKHCLFNTKEEALEHAKLLKAKAIYSEEV